MHKKELGDSKELDEIKHAAMPSIRFFNILKMTVSFITTKNNTNEIKKNKKNSISFLFKYKKKL